MCGIAGLIRLSERPLQPEDEAAVSSQLSAIAHRGPDSMALQKLEDAVIGNVRLRIVGQSEGNQPMTGGGKSLVYNGEIFNYKQLSLARATDHTSDTRTLFDTLSQRATTVLNELNGYFAFCFVDAEFMYLIRDRYGEKPLFYAIEADNLYFCSEIKGLAEVLRLELELPALYPQLETSTGTDTIFKSVHQVKPGTYLRINRKNKTIEHHTWYSYTVQHRREDYETLAEELKQLVTSAIAMRIPPYLPHGAYISGGIDSSIISLCSRPDVLLTYVPNNDLIPSEERYADMVASRLKSRYCKVHPHDELLADLAQAVYFGDGPTTTFAAISQYWLACEAHKQGLRVTLGGMGADEFFGGYIRYLIALRASGQLDGDVRRQYAPLISKLTPADKTPADKYLRLLSRSPTQNPSLTAKVRALFEAYEDPLVAASIADAQFTLPPLMTTDDRMNMAHGVENRSPLLDYRVVEFALSLPQSAKLRKQAGHISTKHILKEAFKDTLPPEILERKDKVGFSSDIAQQLTSRYKQQLENALRVLREAYPQEPYYLTDDAPQTKFSRWQYQVMQLAMTHLIFVQKLSPPDIPEFLSSHSSSTLTV